MWYVHTVAYYSALKTKAIVQYATKCINPEDNKPIPKKQILSDSSFMKYLFNIIKMETVVIVVGVGGRVLWRVIVNKCRVSVL